MNTLHQPDNVGTEESTENRTVLLEICDLILFGFLMGVLLIVPQLIDTYWS